MSLRRLSLAMFASAILAFVAAAFTVTVRPTAQQRSTASRECR